MFIVSLKSFSYATLFAYYLRYSLFAASIKSFISFTAIMYKLRSSYKIKQTCLKWKI